jgi:hypothetical protein
VLACERVLLAASPLNAGAVVAWALLSGVLADVAPATAPFTASAYLLLLYFTLSTPLVSSFYARDVARSARSAAVTGGTPTRHSPVVEPLVLAPQDASLHAANCVALPVGMYICLHRRALMSLPWSADVWMDDAASLALLAACPPLAMCAAHRTALWWWTTTAVPSDAGPPDSGNGPPFQIAFTLLAAIAAMGAHGRIVLHSFRTFLTAAPPWDAVLTGVAAGCAVAVVSVARAHGGMGPALNDASGAAPLIAAAAAGGALAASLAVGIPLWLLPAPIMAATLGLTLTGSPAAAPRESLSLDPGAAARQRAAGSAGLGGRYALAVACGAACVGWFLRAHFMHLHHTLGDTHLPLSTLCLALLAAATVAAAMPGLLAHIAARPEARPAVGALSVCVALHAIFMAWLESVMASEDDASGGTSGVYPPWLLATTTAVGLALPSWLRSRRAIHAWSAGIATWLAAAKLPLLLFPQAGSKGVALTAHVLAAVVSPMMGTQSTRRGASLGAPRVLLHLLAWLLTTFRARFLLFDFMFAATGHRPSDASLLATLCLLTGLLLAMMAPKCRPGTSLAATLRRAAVGALLSALLVTALRPPMPWKGEVGFWYDAAHVPDPEPDDVAMYGAAGRSHQRTGDGAPAWALIAAASAAAASRVTGGTALPFGTAAARMRGGGAAVASAAGVAGATVGWYVATEFLPHQPSGVDDTTFAVCCALACAACGALVTRISAGAGGDAVTWTLLLLQSASTPLALVHLHAAWLTATLHGLDHPRLSAQDNALLADASATLLALSAALNILVAFAVRVRTTAALGAAGRRSSSGAQGKAQASKPDPFSPFANGSVGGPPFGAMGAAAGLPRALASMRTVGNACAWTAFVLVAALNESVSRHPDVSLLLCAPLLLLLTPSAGAADTAGYAAPVRAVWVALAVKAAALVHSSHRHLYPALRNGLCLAVTAPAWLLCAAFLAGARQASVASRDSVFLLIAAPAQVLSLVLTDLTAVRVLACGALVLTLALQSATERRRASTARRL